MNRSSRIQAVLAMALLIPGTANIVRADHGGSAGKSSETRLKTRLTGAAIDGKTPEGSAEFRADSRGRTRLEVEVEHVNLKAATVLQVSLQHGATTTPIGTITLDALGNGELELASQDGDTVPAVQKGDMVTVSNTGTPILAGVF